MSQHLFETTTSSGRNVQVLMGWDRPLQQFFLVVENLDAKQSEDDDQEGDVCPYLYSNLSDVHTIGLTELGYYRQKISELGIHVPQRMFKEVEADQVNNAGNRWVVYDSDGSIRT